MRFNGAHLLTQARLKQVLRYVKRTGEFYWCVAPSRRIHVGDRAGWRHNQGYVGIAIDGHSYLAHRLAWLYVHGQFPIGDLDHKNRNRADNRFANLRLASRTQNLANGRHKFGRSRLKGAHWHAATGRWTAGIGRNGKKIHLGYFATAKAAHAAYCKAAKEMHGVFFHNGAL